MYQDYFELLDIDRNLPAWAYVKKLHDARMRFEREYNGELPDQVKSAITVFGQPEGKADYDQLLAMAEADRVEIKPHDLGRLKSVAEFTHFTLDVLDDETCRITRKPINLPSATTIDADASSNLKLHRSDTTSVVDNPVSVQAVQQPSSTVQGKDKFGRVNGHIPPFIVGTHVYTLTDTVDQYLQQVVDIGDCYELIWQESDGRTWSQRDYLGPTFGASAYQVGVTYRHVVFRNTHTQARTTEGLFTRNARINSFIMSGSGIYCKFPWYSKFLPVRRGIPELEYKWNKYNATMPMPPIDYFGPKQWSAPVTEAFITYIKDLYYWGQCFLRDWTGPLDEMTRLARSDARIVLSSQGIKPRQLSKHGL